MSQAKIEIPATAPKRIDPVGCGCADCLVGYSKPFDLCSEKEFAWCFLGIIQNATGLKLSIECRGEPDY